MSPRSLDPQTILTELCESFQTEPLNVAAKWAASGAMSLTGMPFGLPRQVPAGVTVRMEQLAQIYERLGGPPIDGPALLGERAALTGLSRQGDVSVGGYANLLKAKDQPICINLARPEDLLSLPAWLESSIDSSDWKEIIGILSNRDSETLISQADLLGLPLGVPNSGGHTHPAILKHGGISVEENENPLVLEMGSLWASPLCGDLLRRAGCRVIKVESNLRPDGTRSGPQDFFDLLNGGKESLSIDFKASKGRKLLSQLINKADVVIEGSRPRALKQMGIDAENEFNKGTVWVSITGYGRTGPRSGGVAFGDDAAVSGGLFLTKPLGFVADAVADPAAGLFAATMALAGIASGKGLLIDISLAGVSSWMSGDGIIPQKSDLLTLSVEPPRARDVDEIAAELGFHNKKIKNEFFSLN